jgi:hypothetical protein
MQSTTAEANPAERLVKGLGGRGEVAAKFRVSREAVRLWEEKGIPTDRALDVEEQTRGTEYEITAREVLEFQRQRRGGTHDRGQAA